MIRKFSLNVNNTEAEKNMKHRSTLNVSKIITLVLILSFFVGTISAAPVAENQPTRATAASQQQQKAHKGGRKNKMFSEEDMKAWRNSCYAVGTTGSTQQLDRAKAYEKIKMTVMGVEHDLNNSEHINTTDLANWEKFKGEDFAFLPQRPEGVSINWHLHMQIYVASFGLLHKIQLEEDTRTNNNTMSKELKSIFHSARSLLCEIEDFINSTSSKKIGEENWMTRKQMREILKFKNLTADALYLNRVFVKGRFQVYIKKLYKRIVHQAETNYQEKQIDHPKEKLLKRLRNKNRKTTRRSRKMVNRRKDQNKLEAASTKKVHIVRTTRDPAQKRKNVSRRRNRSTTAASAKV